jgi:hypothetical protein
MSKMDGLRAMREARYEQDRARAAKRTAPPRMAPQSTPTEVSAPPADAQADADLCGHRNMSGRTCTRERGHAAKSHRYS